MKKIVSQKTVNGNFLSAKIDFLICPNTWIFSNFFLIFEYLVFAKRFDRLSRNFLSVRSLFAKTYPNFVTFDSFSTDKLKNQFWLKKR